MNSDSVAASGGDSPGCREFSADDLRVKVFATQEEMAAAAALEVSAYMVDVLSRQDTLRAILATGNSQISFLAKLIDLKRVDWSRVELFHMDEYLGLSADHSASFRRYMRERVEAVVKPRVFHYLEGDALLPLDECDRYTELLRRTPIDLCCLGVGENGHIAFNDPAVADFDDRHWVKLVQLDDDCKTQQVGEGHFPSLETVPGYALTLTIPALCSAKKMVCLSPEKRKQQAVKNALQGPIETACPASYLRRQSQATMFLDADSAALL